jgi:hypothetical protein
LTINPYNGILHYMEAICISGLRFGRLVAITKIVARNKSSSFWGCVCDCGNFCAASSAHLRSGHTTSCGCYRKEITDLGTNTIHNRSKKHDKTYITWKCMRARCNSPFDIHYKWYGARGIKICQEWDDFMQFVADMGERPYGKTLDRIDNDGMYCKENCRWATPKEQSRNNRGLFKKGHASKRW